VFEEQAQFGLNKSSSIPNGPVRRGSGLPGLAEEDRRPNPLVPISADDHEVKDLVDLYAAVEFSIQRHA
jgi:hypothetical protein